MPSSTDTIFALSSGRPPAAIAVVRVSGPYARNALEQLAGRLPQPRQAALARVREPGGDVIDDALVLWFPAPNSETGEDVAEFQLHGGRAVITATLTALGRLDGFRPAEPGEFTRRAFENGKLDLTAAEGLADLVAAETDAQRRHAYRQLKGFLGTRAESWRQRLIEALALVEARIDFADEADVPEDLLGPALQSAKALRDEIAGSLAQSGRGERLREGFVVAIAGPPNAGKSTLLNRIARREAAIVSPYAGTTRDVIEVHLDLDGYPVTLLDTAGIRPTDDPVEQEGVRRARERAAGADLVLWVINASAGTSLEPAPTGAWIVRNKVDLLVQSAEGRNEYKFLNELLFNVSARDGTGLDHLIDSLAKRARAFLEGSDTALISRERHRNALMEAISALERALSEGDRPGREDLVAEELRLAARALGRLLGKIDVEDLLDTIFREFCIGK
jgi:tRNA modification GTPase